jgi:hypothetical protein
MAVDCMEYQDFVNYTAPGFKAVMYQSSSKKYQPGNYTDYNSSFVIAPIQRPGAVQIPDFWRLNLNLFSTTTSITIDSWNMTNKPFSSVFSQQKDFNLTDLFGTTNSRFENLYGSQVVMISAMWDITRTRYSFEVYFLHFQEVGQTHFHELQVKIKKAIDFPDLSFPSNSTLFFSEETVIQVIPGLYKNPYLPLTFVIVDTYSFFMKGVRTQSLDIDYNALTVDLPLYLDSPEFPDIVYLINGNSRMVGFDVRVPGCTGNLMVIDLDLLSVRIRNYNNAFPNPMMFSVSMIANDPMIVFNPFVDENITNPTVLTKVSSAKSFIGIDPYSSTSPQLDFAYKFTILYNTTEKIFVNEAFNVTGEFILNFGQFLKVDQTFFAYPYQIFCNLGYKLYLPWKTIRGSDISIIPTVQVDNQTLNVSFTKTLSQNIVLVNVTLNSPASYYTNGDYLLVMDQNFNESSVSILIFQLANYTSNQVTYLLAHNSTYGNQYNVSETLFRGFIVNYDCIVAYVEFAQAKSANISATVITYCGPIYLESNYTTPILENNRDWSLQGINQTNVYFVFLNKSAEHFLNEDLVILNLNSYSMSDVEGQTKLGPSDFIIPRFCPSMLINELFDSRYLLVQSDCLIIPQNYFRLDLFDLTLKLDLFVPDFPRFSKDMPQQLHFHRPANKPDQWLPILELSRSHQLLPVLL